jgi:8-oxo-dGTP diphosphatase
MTEYVCGFVFSESADRVALIQKKRPTWQAGKFNGIGGHIEPGESAAEAIRREFREETGLTIFGWQQFCRLRGGNEDAWRVNFFRAFGLLDDCCAQINAREIDEGTIFVLPIDDLFTRPHIPNLRWLIPLALDRDKPIADIVETAAQEQSK